MNKKGDQMKLEQWPLEKLKAYENNPRQNDHAVEKMARAIREFGFRVPIIAKSDGQIIDGHLRLKAARAAGLKQVTVILADDMTEAQIKAFRISVNRMAELADWDLDLLKAELEGLQALDFDLDLTGLDDELMDEILRASPENAGMLKEENILLTPFRQTHILLSFPPSRLIDIQAHIEKIREYTDVDYEIASN